MLHQLTSAEQNTNLTEAQDNLNALRTEANHGVSSPNILILNIDCLEELCDLRALRQTCKRMNKTVDYFIRATYPRGFGKLNFREMNCREIQHIDASICKLYKHLEFRSNGALSVELAQN